MKEIVRATSVVVAKGNVACEIAGEAVILNLQSGIYYGLNPVGARVWSLIQARITVDRLLEILLDKYDVTPERCEHEVLALLDDMAAKNLIVTENKRNAYAP